MFTFRIENLILFVGENACSIQSIEIMEKRETLIHAIKCCEGVITKNGGSSNIYINIKRLYGDFVLGVIVDLLYEKIRDTSATCVAGEGMGGVPLASALNIKYKIPAVLVHKEQKGHGTGLLIEGYPPDETDKVAVVDDVFTTGGSLKSVMEILKPTGADIQGCHVVVNRGEEKERARFDVPLTYIISLKELL